ncbi:MAG TPA: CBS domain-containing protein [Thermoanaerobaculia bacterium]|nr:CBS domain-containing protein [Thermoanaerobaculia bacterium]
MRLLTAKDVMNPNVITVFDDMSVDEAAAVLVDNEISGAPVENRDGQLVGVLSLTDIAEASAEGRQFENDRSNPEFFVRGWEEKLSVEEMRRFHVEDEGVLVREIMTPTVYSVDESTPISEVAETMIDSHIHRLLVTQDEKTSGIISTSDLLGLLVEVE